MAKIKFVDVTKCDGCRGCMAACKNWNDLPAEQEEFNGSIQSHKALTANTWNLITFTEVETEKGGVNWLFRHAACMHCNDAGCERVCPENAISKNIHGAIVIDEDKCVGCGYCVANCPFDVIQLKDIEKNGKKQKCSGKCTLCSDRLERNLEPACAKACHTDAIVYGDKETILEQAELRLEVVSEKYPNANIYNPAGVGETNTVYLLADKPEVYGLPANPKTPLAAKLYKSLIRPGTKLIFGAAAATVITATISNAILGNDGSHGHDHGHDDGHKAEEGGKDLGN